ncbi:hypothetical protein [Kineosporia sp. NBRC 101731]|uniref:hypothetical protein n=1 Tax=Kineosporia sp. NBRC 101731 TaxID=3032199 RepID=UPI002554DA2C|nr:hypothetical protein [Kineosporia sp. NBRC 101731]
MAGGFEWDDYPSHTAFTAVPGKTVAEVRSWPLFGASWLSIDLDDIDRIIFERAEPFIGNDLVILHQRPGGTLIWEPRAANLALGAAISRPAREQSMIMGSVVSIEGKGASFSVADANGLVSASSNLMDDELFGNDPRRYADKFHEFGVVPGRLTFLPCVKLVEFATGMEIQPPQNCPEGEELIFGRLASVP